MRSYLFRDVSTGTTLATVIENVTAGATVNGAGTSATVADSGVTTLGPDRLALQFTAINDDNAQTIFTGAGLSGGIWAEAVAEYADSGGTDGSIGLQTAAIISPDVRTASATDDVFGDLNARQSRGQSFVAAGNATAVTVTLRKYGTPTDSIEVSIAPDSGGLPSVLPIETAFLSGTSLTTSLAEYTVPLTASLTSGVTYWVTLGRATDAANYYGWARTSAAYSGGSGAIADLGTWSADSQDHSFGITCPSATGTINGGAFTQADGTDGWGVVGFALIGTTVDVVTYVPRNPAINHQNPALV
jgi:hypothetical protein